MGDGETPVNIGTLKKTGTVETPEGQKILLETDQGEFLLTCESKGMCDSLCITADMYTRYVVAGET